MADDIEQRITAASDAIIAAGYSLQYVEYCENTRTPGLLGMFGGVTDHRYREVRIGLVANPTRAAIADTLEHELRHVQDPSWDCGNRDVFGRGGPYRS